MFPAFSVLNRITLHKLARNDEPLEFVGPLPDDKQRSVTVVAFDVVFRRISVGTVNTHRLQGILEGGLGGIELRHAGLHIAALASVINLGGLFGKQPCGLDASSHVGKLDLD